MADKIVNINEHLNKKDLELILEVNKKAIEVETEVAEQNEEILEYLFSSKDAHAKFSDKIDKNIKQTEDLTKKHDDANKEVIKKIDEINKEIFKMQVLFIVGIINLVVQIIQLFLKK